MLKFVARRLILAIPTLLGVSFLVFMLIHFIPGDPARIMAGEAAPPEMVEQMRENLGLNDPLLVQFGRFLGNAIRGDLGTTIRGSTPVVSEIFDVRFGNTVQLALLSVMTSTTIGLIAGIISAIHKGSFVDWGVMILALTFLSMPNFWLGIMLIHIFAVNLGWTSVAGWGTLSTMILPVAMLGLTASAIVARMTRASLIDVLNQDYIRTAYSKGASERLVIYKHALRNALIPVITVVGLQFGFLLSGAVITESIFAINGIGRLMIEAIRSQDYPLVQGTALIIALMFVIVNVAVDLTYNIVNKRVEVS